MDSGSLRQGPKIVSRIVDSQPAAVLAICCPSRSVMEQGMTVAFRDLKSASSFQFVFELETSRLGVALHGDPQVHSHSKGVQLFPTRYSIN